MTSAYCRYSCWLMLNEARIELSVETVVSTWVPSTRFPTRTRAMPATPSMGARTRAHSRLSAAVRRLPRMAVELASAARTAGGGSFGGGGLLQPAAISTLTIAKPTIRCTGASSAMDLVFPGPAHELRQRRTSGNRRDELGRVRNRDGVCCRLERQPEVI